MTRLWLFALVLLFAAPAWAQFDRLNAPQLESKRENAITPQLIVNGRSELAILMKVKPGWHGYWLNPGDAGLPMSVEWKLSAGWTVGQLQYPVPTRLNASGIVNYVYEGDYALLAALTAPAGVKGGPTRIAANMRWLACTDEVCVPEEGRAELDIPAGKPASPDPRFAAWRDALPKSLPHPATFQRDGELIRISVPLPASIELTNPYFFPATDGALDYDAPQDVRREGDHVVIEVKAGTDRPRVIAGVLAGGKGPGWDVVARPGNGGSSGQPLWPFLAGATILIAAAAGLFVLRRRKARD